MFTKDFGRKKYPTPNMAFILKVTTTVGSRAYEPSLKAAKHLSELEKAKKRCLRGATRAWER